MRTDFVHLKPTEVIQGRPFTDPKNSTADLANLQYIADKVRYLLLAQPEHFSPQLYPMVIYLSEQEGRYFRITVAQPDRLQANDDFYAVGFCGVKRPTSDRGPVDNIDEELIEEFPQHPNLICYCTLEVEPGYTCNLVLFDDPAGLLHWSRSAKHAQAVALSPSYYYSIRLHNALLPGGLFSSRPLMLLRTKYFDFHEDTVWWGVRELPVQ
ncbi:MAG: hypothetical protein H6632_15550 [Anaerolineales bacterium]|nr:hypothetical protein [Anaerolineales bacterium]